MCSNASFLYLSDRIQATREAQMMKAKLIITIETGVIILFILTFMYIYMKKCWTKCRRTQINISKFCTNEEKLFLYIKQKCFYT
jgi:hypothetical protein